MMAKVFAFFSLVLAPVYLPKVGPGAGTYGGGGNVVQSVTLDVNGRVTAVATSAASSGKTLQTQQTQITADTTYASTGGSGSDGVFHDLTSATVSITTTTGTHLRVFMSAGAVVDGSANGLLDFQVKIDNVVPRGGEVIVTNAAFASVAFPVDNVVYVAVSSGAHTVKVQWKAAVGTPHINASTVPASQFCTLIVDEVIVP